MDKIQIYETSTVGEELVLEISIPVALVRPRVYIVKESNATKLPFGAAKGDKPSDINVTANDTEEFLKNMKLCMKGKKTWDHNDQEINRLIKRMEGKIV